MSSHRSTEAGLTLVELIVSLALFALVALAGLGLVDGVLGIERGTDGRLARLADRQRAMFTLSADLAQLAPGALTGGGAALSFVRPLGGRPTRVRYALSAGALRRIVPTATQTLLPQVAAARFRFWTPRDGWLDRWPPAPVRATERPAAIEATVAVQPGGTLRRVVALPSWP